jgi:hypothetical protein
MSNLSGAHLAAGNPTKGRNPSDFYTTPPLVTQALIDADVLPSGSSVWEPCCGDGAMSKVLIANGFDTYSSDLYFRGYGVGGVDILNTENTPIPNAGIITNPPFNISSEIIEHVLGNLQVPFLALVLKSQYWHGAKRSAIFKKHQPTHVLPLLWRPDFQGCGGSPTMEVLWTVWDANTARGRTLYYPLPKPTTFKQ